MSILFKVLPSSACLSHLPAFKKLMRVPTTIGTIIKIVEIAPKLIEKGKGMEKQVTNIITTLNDTKATTGKGGET